MARQTGPAFHRRRLTLALRQAVGSQGRTPSRWISLLLLCTSSLAFSDSDCATDAGRLESSEGSVAIETDGSWRPLAVGDCVPVGVRIQISEGRAVFRLANETLLRASGSTLLRIAQPQQKNWIRLFDGLLHIITRTPHAFDVETDYVNAGVKGTEFILAANRNEKAGEIIMLEGEVLASNAQGEQSVRSGSAITARAGQAPTATTIPALRYAVQWTLYYPPVPLSNDTRFQAAQQQLYRGNAAAALKQLDVIPQDQRDADYFARLGAINLYRGDIALANGALVSALEKQPNHPQALALQALALLTTGDTGAAATTLDRAQTRSSNDSTVLIARSYLEQSRFELDAAQASARKAVDADNNNALAHARLAELALTNGDTKLASTSIDTALRLQPDFGRALAIKGFAQLQQLDFDAAETSFKTATAQNPTDPLPHLGLGLINIRRNHVTEGREQLALAVALDPGQSQLRSYLGKAYQEEGREQLAADQYALAKKFDAADPTPWLYSALLARVQNRPFDALDDLNQSIALNDNRAVYRSRLQLDADEAVRTASQAEIYRELGFDELAQRSAADAVSRAPGEYAGHRQLAESYADNPQYDAARASEVLQAQLLQPLSATPILPLLGETNLLAITGAGPGELGFREYNAMFVREKPWLSVSGLGGSNHTGAGEITISGVSDRIAYAFNQYHYENRGYRDNNDARYDVLSAYTKLQATENLSFLLLLAQKEEDRGDIAEQLSVDADSPFLQVEQTNKTAQLGVHYQPSDWIDLLGVASYRERDLREITNFSSPTFDLDDQLDESSDTSNLEVQAHFTGEQNNLVTGIDWAEIMIDSRIATTVTVPPDPPFNLPEMVGRDTSRFNTGYAYWMATPTGGLQTTIGAAYAELDRADLAYNIEKWSPKIALMWEPMPGLHLRTAYYGTLRRPTEMEDTLEPTQVGGFTQVFDEQDGTYAKQAALGLDFAIGNNHWLGADFFDRDMHLPLSGQAETVAIDQQLFRAFWSHAADQWAISLTYSHEESSVPAGQNRILNIPSQLITKKLPLRIKYQFAQRITFTATTTYIDQNADILIAGNGSEKSGDNFTTMDLSLRYQLLQRRAEITGTASNIFDKSFAFQNTNIYDNSAQFIPIIPERTFSIGFKYRIY